MCILFDLIYNEVWWDKLDKFEFVFDIFSSFAFIVTNCNWKLWNEWYHSKSVFDKLFDQIGQILW